MKKAVGGKTRVDLAVDQIIQVILDRDMKAGDKLPNEYDLARELGVGRSTLREAIKRLVARNILTARQGAGTFVSEKNGVPEDPLGLTFMMEEGSENLALDLQDIRLMLEPETCAIVARGATPEQIDQMQAYCDEATRLIEAEEDYSAADAKFHQYFAECSGNHVLPNLIPIIASAIGVVITVTNDEHRSQSGMEHQRIIDAIRRHDPEGAKYSMIAHLNTSRNSMVHSRDNCAAKLSGHAVLDETMKQFDAFYIPGGESVTITALEDCIFYIAGAVYEGIGHAFFRSFDLSQPVGDIHQIHGEGIGQREVMMTLSDKDEASRLICGLTWGGEGAWTSWPPHQHEKDLEEVYCYFGMPLPHFGFHISYLKSGEVEDIVTHTVHSGTMVEAPVGYHPTVASPGTRNSYLWVLAAHSHSSRSYNLAVLDPALENFNSAR